MLILTRKPGQRIHIGDDIVVYVNRVNGGRSVSIGVEAPKGVTVLRDELVPNPRPETAMPRRKPTPEADEAAIRFALSDMCHAPDKFIQLYNAGDFEAIRRNWPSAPELIFSAD